MSNNPKLKKKLKAKAGLRETMLSRMDSARLRYLNDEMYSDNKKVLKKKTAFKVYHESFEKQQQLWDSNPLDNIVKDLKSLYSRNKDKTNFCIADLGCGNARIANEFEKMEVKIYSIDFVAMNDKVTACDMAHTGITDSTVDVVVFCLSLMSSKCNEYIKEAYRILKPSGLLLIAEVTSRLENVDTFVGVMKEYGFVLNGKTFISQEYFIYFKFRKVGKVKSKRSDVILQPCKYKKR